MLEQSAPESNKHNHAKQELRPLEHPLHRESLSKGIVLHVAPRIVVPWEEFQQTTPPFSIGLDGLVYGRPRFAPTGPHLNFNHHEEVDRLGTRSTSAQVLLALKQELMKTFSCEGAPKINIFVNDPDQDTSLAVWLLNNHERLAAGKSEPLINKIVIAEDLLDATAGAFPFDPTNRMMREFNWVFDPYNQARADGRIFGMAGSELANVIIAVGERISRYTLGNADELPLDLRFEVIGGGTGWTMVREIGSAARTGLYHSGARAFVAVRDNPNGTWTYSLGKMSPFVQFPITDLYNVLNAAEGLVSGSANSWGGGDIIGGSPRQTGSRLAPKELQELLNNYLNKITSLPYF
jgi:hypothetical protein